jgi:hypothetical protein
MCTLSWIAERDGYQILFNRDEQRSREPARPPELYVRDGVRFVAPRDGASGGTWIAADDAGLCLCVLNGSDPSGSAPRAGGAAAWETRGRLPFELIGATDADEAVERLARIALERFRPFFLAAFDAAGGAALARWNGQTLARVPDALSPHRPLVSSSYSSEEVRSCRRATFERLARVLAHRTPVERHLAFHRSHEPERGARSPCMHRDDATTVSFTRVEVGSGCVRMHYVPHAPCRGLAGPTIELPRHSHALDRGARP